MESTFFTGIELSLTRQPLSKYIFMKWKKKILACGTWDLKEQHKRHKKVNFFHLVKKFLLPLGWRRSSYGGRFSFRICPSDSSNKKEDKFSVRLNTQKRLSVHNIENLYSMNTKAKCLSVRLLSSRLRLHTIIEKEYGQVKNIRFFLSLITLD